MNLIALKDIRVAENRQRREFEPAALNELRESIVTSGLFHPPVLREENGKFFLVAGERRLRAMADIYDLGDTFRCDNEIIDVGYTPYVTLGELGELEREEAELDENIKRTDLSWQEKASATARLSDLRKKQAVALNQPMPTHIDIAEEIRGGREGRDREAIRRELIVSQHLHKPEVAAAKTVDEAFKALKREEAITKNKEIAEKVGRTFTSAVHRVYNQDCLGWLYSCAENSFDVILTDPPYGMGADEFGDSGGMAMGAHGYSDDLEGFIKVLKPFAAEAFRVAKEQAHAYLFCDLDNFHVLKGWMRDAGWEVHRTPLVWYKPSGNRIPWVGIGPQRQYELILYAVKGKKQCNMIASDVLNFRTDTNIGHAAQKPVALFEELLKRSCRAGDSVLDPFCGSGPIFPAAHGMKVTATGIEIDSSSYGIAVQRIQGLK